MVTWVSLTLSLVVTSLHLRDVIGQCSSVTTFNTGLTNYVAKVDSRIPLIAKAIEENSADVFCLQEVWYERVLKNILDATERTYPYHYSALHNDVGQLRRRASSFMSWLSPDTPCSGSEVAFMVKDVLECAMREGCMGGTGQTVGNCLAKKCKRELKSRDITQSCLSCMLFSLASLTDTVSECARMFGANNRFNGPGLVVLSKKPITSIRYNNFHPFNKMWVERGYIQADIQDVGKVTCTHLAASFDDYMEFDTIYRSYEQQQAAEIRALNRVWFHDHILLGDLNTGPSLNFPFDPSRSITETYPRNYQSLLSYGYSDPYSEQVRMCTYCTEDPYAKGSQNHILDHVLTKGGSYRGVAANRVMTDYRGMALSDHYGVQLKFCILSG